MLFRASRLDKIQTDTMLVTAPGIFMTNATSDTQHDDRQRHDRQHKRALTTLLEKGVAAIGLGAACLVAPSFLEPSPTTIAIAAGLRMGGWIAIGVGLVLLGVRFSVQNKARKLSSLPRRDNRQLESRPARLDQQELPVFNAEATAPAQSFAIGAAPASAPEGSGPSR